MPSTPRPAKRRRPAPLRPLAHDLLDCTPPGLVALDPAGPATTHAILEQVVTDAPA